MQICDLGQSDDEQSSYQLHGNTDDVVGDLEEDLAALCGASVRRQVGRKKDCLKGSKLSPLH